MSPAGPRPCHVRPSRSRVKKVVDPMIDFRGKRRRANARMDRRGFLALAGAATAGAVGTLGPRARGRDPSPDAMLNNAAGPPEGARLGTQRVIWSVDTDEPTVAFTFDDGPAPDLTPRILDILDDYDVKATFFVMGYSVERAPQLAAEVAARGHEIGNHTWTHVDMTRNPPTEARRQLLLCQDAVREAVGTTPKYFRPPRGQLTGTAARYAAESGYDVVLWSVGRGVSGVGTARAIADHVVTDVEPGDIVLLHDGVGREFLRTDLDGPGPVRRRRLVELEALPAIIEGTLARGLRPTTMSGLLAAAQ